MDLRRHRETQHTDLRVLPSSGSSGSNNAATELTNLAPPAPSSPGMTPHFASAVAAAHAAAVMHHRPSPPPTQPPPGPPHLFSPAGFAFPTHQQLAARLSAAAAAQADV